jgi:hypothetical protein
MHLGHCAFGTLAGNGVPHRGQSLVVLMALFPFHSKSLFHPMPKQIAAKVTGPRRQGARQLTSERGKEITNLFLDLFRARNGLGNLRPQMFAITRAESAHRHLDGGFGRFQFAGDGGIG